MPAVIACFLIALLVAWPITAVTIGLAPRIGLLDEPNDRSSHTRPTPRGGGIGICAGIGAGWVVAAVAGQAPPVGVGACLIAIAALGFWDDIARGISPAIRFPIQAAACAGIIATCGSLDRLPLPPPLDIELGFLGWPVTLIWMLGVLNIYNFLDGIDGFAGSQAMIASVGLALLPVSDSVRLLAIGVAGASIGFLRWNWHPARIFMGDVGSTTLGVVLAAAPLMQPNRPIFVMDMGLLLWFFLADGALTIVRRIAHRESIWKAHRTHLYQRLAAGRYSHADVVLRVGTMMIAVAAVTIVAAHTNLVALQWLAICFAVGLFVRYYVWATQRETDRTGASSD